MNLIETVTPAPAHGIVSPVSIKRKLLLRSARWPPNLHDGTRREAAGTVVICTGRSEFIEKYFEVVEELRRRGFAVVVFEWRGQGLSGRLLRNPLKGHIRSFVDYEQDLDALVQQVLEPFCPRPWFGLAHSMGGPIALHYAARRPDVFRRLVLSAPMIEIAHLPIADAAPIVAKWAVRLGLGRAYVPVGPGRPLFLSTFDGNVLTSDLHRFERTAALLRAEPRLGIGLPTLGWMNAAFDSMSALQQERFTERFTTPTLFIMPGADRVVDLRAAERLAANLRASAMVVIRHSRHEIMMERDSLRDQFWAAFDAFVPGTDTAVPAPPPRRDAVPMRIGAGSWAADGAGT